MKAWQVARDWSIEGMELVELPHLAISAPAQVAGPGLAQVRVGEQGQSSLAVELGGQLIGKRFVLHEAVLVS